MLDIELYLGEVGKRIMERRKKLGLTQEAFAEMSDLTKQFVSYAYAESGKMGMRPENLSVVVMLTKINIMQNGSVVLWVCLDSVERYSYV